MRYVFPPPPMRDAFLIGIATLPPRQRWGDAPVHSIGASLFADADRIHMFRDIGYEHPPYMHCPVEDALWERGRCGCDRAQNFGMQKWPGDLR
jgi:hypothetical protein